MHRGFQDVELAASQDNSGRGSSQRKREGGDGEMEMGQRQVAGGRVFVGDNEPGGLLHLQKFIGSRQFRFSGLDELEPM